MPMGGCAITMKGARLTDMPCPHRNHLKAHDLAHKCPQKHAHRNTATGAHTWLHAVSPAPSRMTMTSHAAGRTLAHTHSTRCTGPSSDSPSHPVCPAFPPYKSDALQILSCEGKSHQATKLSMTNNERLAGSGCGPSPAKPLGIEFPSCNTNKQQVTCRHKA